MTSNLNVACIQMNSGPEIEKNIETATILVREAAQEGAQLIATPENTCHIRTPSTEKLKSAKTMDEHPGIPAFSNLAKELGVWLLIGSMTIKVDDNKLLNRSLLFSDTGELSAFYDKIHLFDAYLSQDESYQESQIMQHGDHAVLAQTPWCSIGMTICYDLRFSHLYRDLAKAGASILAVPSAFTVPTGRSHWEVLLRARAIETGSYVIAPGQTGEHEGKRKTWGHSMIIDPWGEVLANAGDSVGVISRTIDIEKVKDARRKLPTLTHDKEYKLRA